MAASCAAHPDRRVTAQAVVTPVTVGLLAAGSRPAQPWLYAPLGRGLSVFEINESHEL